MVMSRNSKEHAGKNKGSAGGLRRQVCWFNFIDNMQVILLV